MIEILPNWHPIFVHFTVALFVISAFFYVLSTVGTSYNFRHQARLVARWNLWAGMVFTVFTLIAGMIAYNTVDHDTPSHLVMKDHRLVALVTAGVFLILSIWSMMAARADKDENRVFVGAMVIGVLLLMTTAWLGGELVYRHGLGVQSLPDMSQHDHAEGQGHDHGTSLDGNGGGHDSLEGEAHGHDAPAKSDSHLHEDGKAHQH